jgi:tetratricopeptide (TPR) repeat protein
VLRVPIFVKLPGARRRGETVRHPVQLIDIFPTIARLLGQEPSEQLPGRSLLEAPGKGSPDGIYSETYYPRIHLGWSELRSLWGGRYHFIDSPEPELYDLGQDSHEKADVFSGNPDVARAMKRNLNGYPVNFSGPGAVNAEDLKKLAALGYISVTTRAGDGEGLPSPARNIGLLAEIKDAFRVEAAGERGRAIALFRKLLEKNPRLFDVRYKLAETLAGEKRFREAAEAYKEAIRISPSAAGPVALALARVSLARGELREAELNADLAMRESPAEARQVLARVALASNDLEGVEREVRLAAGGPGSGADNALLVAEVRLRRNQPREALALLDSALDRLREKGRQPPSNFQFLRGDALARLGRYAEAQEAFQEEIRFFPADSEAYSRLAILYAVQKRLVKDVYDLLEKMHAANPGPDSAMLAAKTLDSIGDARGAGAWRNRAVREK